ncbi:polyprenyl synthetase family protein [Oenococcus sp.]|uniref:polyprenyl synthetase family protein n=1 Tax=Oenococcus sp. TaxID=1979414 RepID=UPI0039EA1C1B
MATLFQGYHFASQDAKAVRDILAKQRFPIKPYQDKVENMLKQNGKMLRATLANLFGRYGLHLSNGLNRTTLADVHQGAAAIEVLHLATLVHDDVVDDADQRRGLTTLQHFFGNKDTIYLGDQLFTKYFQLLIAVSPSNDFIRYHADMMEKILSGELIQDRMRFNQNIQLADYYQAIQGKTAALFSLSAVSGLWLGSGIQHLQDAKTTFQAAYQFGENLGMAFQMIDDLQDLDMTAKTGKPKFEDLKEGVYTLPIILALADADFQAILKNDHPGLNQVIGFFQSHSEYFQSSREICQHFLLEAQKNLDFFQPEDEIKELQKLIKQIQSQLDSAQI